MIGLFDEYYNFLYFSQDSTIRINELKKNIKMPLLLLAIAISSVFSAVIVKTTDYEKKVKQPITNRRHNGTKSKLLDINKDLSI